MKFIKTYEETFTINLDKKEQLLLIKSAFNNKDSDLFEELIKSKIISNKNLILPQVKRILLSQNIHYHFIETIIESGIFDEDTLSLLLNTAIGKNAQVISKSKNELMALIVLLLENGASPIKNFNKFYSYEPVMKNFLDDVEERLKDKSITENFYNRIIKFIKNRYPNYYEEHQLNKNSDKYNL